MMLQKWDFNKHEYLPFEVPDDREVVLYSPNMERPIDCTGCGKHMTYGKGYTSRTIHTQAGLGYPVCDECYEIEWKDERESKDNEVRSN